MKVILRKDRHVPLNHVFCSDESYSFVKEALEKHEVLLEIAAISKPLIGHDLTEARVTEILADLIGAFDKLEAVG